MPSPPTSPTTPIGLNAALGVVLAFGPATGAAPSSDERLLFADGQSIVAVSQYESTRSPTGAPRIVGAPSLRATVANLFDAKLVDPAGPKHRMDRMPLSGRRFWAMLDVAF